MKIGEPEQNRHSASHNEGHCKGLGQRCHTGKKACGMFLRSMGKKKVSKWAMERLKWWTSKWWESELSWSPWNTAVMGESKLFKNEVSAVTVRCLRQENRKSKGKRCRQSIEKNILCKRLWERGQQAAGKCANERSSKLAGADVRQNTKVQWYHELCEEFRLSRAPLVGENRT